jgi:myo-inositol catabolism protein IolC
VLVRFNVDGSRADNDVQIDRLRQLSSWLVAQGRPLLLELLVPPTAPQLHEVGGSRERYDAELRPGLMVRAIAALQEAGVVVANWKIEGVETRADCDAVARATRSGSRDDVTCLVLGRGADTAQVEHWLAQAAPVEGFAGFAIGRSIWGDAVIAHLDARLDEAQAAEVIAERFAHFVGVYRRER